MKPSVEEWRDIPGFEGIYQVSSIGRVRSADRLVAHSRSGAQTVRGRVMSPTPDRHGYPRFFAFKDGAKPFFSVHRALMAAFVPRDDWQSMQVNHKDGNPRNCTLENLEWCTNSENRIHAYRVLKRTPSGAGKFGELHHNSRRVVAKSIGTGEIRRFAAYSEAARHLGCAARDVSACVRGEQRSAAGWMFMAGDAVPDSWLYEPKRTPSGPSNCQAKAVVRVSADGAEMYYAAAVLARVDGFNPVGISHVLKGRANTHGGYRWRYADESMECTR